MEIAKISAAFIKAQSEMGNAVKDSKNPFFKSAYADLNSVREACIPALNNNEIAVLQPTVQIDGKNYVKTILLHSSGETIESLTEILFAKQNDPQAQGSGITYARRYGLQSLVCIGAEDDDGNKAAEAPKNGGNGFFKKPSGPLAGIAQVAHEDLNEQREKKKRDAAESFFRETKAKFEEEFGSLEEVQGLESQCKNKLDKLRSNYPDLHSMLAETIDAAKIVFVGEE